LFVAIPVILVVAVIFKRLAALLVLVESAQGFLGGVGKQALDKQPPEIHLARSDNHAWTKRPGGIGLADPLIFNGFSDVGTYSINEMPGLFLRFLVKEQESVGACVYEHPKAGVLDRHILALHRRNASLLRRLRRGLERRPGSNVIHAPGSAPKASTGGCSARGRLISSSSYPPPPSSPNSRPPTPGTKPGAGRRHIGRRSGAAYPDAQSLTPGPCGHHLRPLYLGHVDRSRDLGRGAGALFIHDRWISNDNVLRNFPVIGHLRYLLIELGPEIRQYIIAGNHEELPFQQGRARLDRALGQGREQLLWVRHRRPGLRDRLSIIKHAVFPHGNVASLARSTKASRRPCAKVLGETRGRAKAWRPASIVNVSAMSFGSLGANAVKALNLGAKEAGCWHNTGEGGSPPTTSSART